MMEPDLIITHLEDLQRHVGWQLLTTIIAKKLELTQIPIGGRMIEQIAIDAVRQEMKREVLAWVQNWPVTEAKAAREELEKRRL